MNDCAGIIASPIRSTRQTNVRCYVEKLSLKNGYAGGREMVPLVAVNITMMLGSSEAANMVSIAVRNFRASRGTH